MHLPIPFCAGDANPTVMPYRRPVANSIAEKFVGTCRREVLDHLLVFGRGHLEMVLGEFIEHYHDARPHQGLEQRPPCEPAVLHILSIGKGASGDAGAAVKLIREDAALDPNVGVPTLFWRP